MVNPVHALAGPDTSTAQPRPTWTWRRVILAAVLAADLVYTTVVFSTVFGAGWDRWLPPPASGLVTGTLIGATIVAVAGVRHARINDRIDLLWVTIAGMVTALTEDVQAVKGVAQEIAAEVKRIPDDPTVPLSGRRPRPYGRATVAHGAAYGPSGAWNMVRPRLAGTPGDAGGGQWEEAPVREAFMHGYRLGQQHKANGGENVVPLPPAHGG